MGCDGGTIPKRNELVKPKKKPELKDKTSQLSFRWSYCQFSQEPLLQPIVACGYGRLYNKLALIEGLLDRTTLADNVKHIKSLSDVKDVKLTSNPEKKENSADFICPVTGLEMNGNFQFVFLWSCGCVFSERALKMVGEKLCQICTKSFRDEDVVTLNADGANEMDLMKSRIEIRRKQQKRLRESDEEDKKESKQRSFGQSSNVVNTRSVCVGEHQRLKRLTIVKVSEERKKKFKSNCSIPTDQHKSDVYKSLFTKAI